MAIENEKKEQSRMGQQPSAPGTSSAPSVSPSTGVANPSTAEAKPESLLPSLTLPKGGGAIRGIGEKFATSAPTGTGALSVPIATSPGRAGFQFGLTLDYDSGAGNGPFGIGWHLSTPAISRKTDKGLPRYANDQNDDQDRDVFILSGAEDLVPVHVPDDARTRTDVVERGEYRVQRYRPRVEGLFARIERWTHRTSGDIHWRVTTRDNTLNVYGRNPQARIADPEQPERVFSWLLEETRDDRGNVARYTYKPEDAAGVDPRQASEANRFAHDCNRENTFLTTAQRYLKRIQYGNRVPVSREAPAPTRDDEWLFEVVLDYGEHDVAAPTPHEVKPWLVRADPFSSYRPTFEVRTYRLCQRVLMFHRFAELGPGPVLVRSTDFTHDQGPVVTYLTSVTQAGYMRDSATGTYQRAAMPSLDLQYIRPVVHHEVQTIDRDSLAGVDDGIDGATAQWVDLDGEGIPGVLVPAERSWYYKANRGGGKLDPPALMRALPSPAELGGGVQQLADLGADGNLDLVQYTPPLSGYFERTSDRTFAPFVPLSELPNIDWNDPNLRFLDIDGDGRVDVLITENDAFVWYRSRGEDGFESGGVVPHAKDELKGPAVIFADGSETIQLADMSGDGLVDIVRVRSGEVCYWPNLGYGRFGRRVTLDANPRFDAPDMFDPKRVRFADIDGSGTSDIVYLGRDGVRLYFNQSGNGFSAVTKIETLPPVDSLSSLTVVDLLGQGTACLVLSTPWPDPQLRRVTFVDLMGGKKPHLLESVANNLGAETRIAYTSSTKFYLADKAAGHPWLTRLPFPVQVVERTEHVDLVSKSRLVTIYSYHHGFFDGFEREFRGFARVETIDAESFSGHRGIGLFPNLPYDVTPNDPDIDLPPVRNVTWFHTGAWLERERLEYALAEEFYSADPSTPQLPGVTLPAGLSVREEREATRALRGQVLRQEIYADDGTPQAPHPYTVSQRNYEVRLVQHANGADHAVFFAHPRHTLNQAYERNPNDPRLQHDVVLVVDDFGNVRQSASIGYPRRLPTEPEQGRLWVTVLDIVVANQPDENDGYRIGIPIEITSSELTGLNLPSATDLLSVEALRVGLRAAREIPLEATATPSIVERRSFRRRRQTYYSDDLDRELPLGQIGLRALPFQTYDFALSPGLVARTYGDLVTNETLEGEAGYVNRDGLFWAPSGRTVFAPTQFYLPVESIDPFGQHSFVRYDDYALLALETEDALQNRLTAGRRDAAGRVTLNGNDYRTLRPVFLTDPNLNRSAIALDALGMVTRVALMGKEGAGEGDTLEDPTTRIVYDMLRFQNTGGKQPVFTHTLSRERHGSANPRFQETYSYSDGFGREVMRKVQSEPGPAPLRDATGALIREPDGSLATGLVKQRWVGTGRTVFNNKGDPVKQYEPFFSSIFEYEDEKDLVQSGVTPILRYDALGRLVRNDLPSGAFRRIVLEAWRKETWDENDTVLESVWFQRRGAPNPNGPEPRNQPARRAAWLAAQHANTPTILHMDSLGRPFLTSEDNRAPEGVFQTRARLDVAGNRLSVVDARGTQAIRQQVFDALDRRLFVDTADAGSARTLLEVQNKPIRSWNARGFAFHHTYDELRRPKGTFLCMGEDAEKLVDVVFYGEQHPEAAERNLRTRVYQTYDGAGLGTSAQFDFKGNLIRATRRLAKGFKETPDWSMVTEAHDPRAAETMADALLEDASFTTNSTYDALDRIISQVAPDGSETLPSYNEANLLESMQVRVRGSAERTPFVANIDYDARGKRVRVEYGNGTVSDYEYETDTFRLSRLSTSRRGGGSLQDLRYEYDPIGNIVEFGDRVSFGNPSVPADGLYAYDPLYRLTRAEGREHPGRHSGPDDPGSLGFEHPNDLQALARYQETYAYDPVGNLLRVAHDSLQSPRRRTVRLYEYAPGTNRLLRSGRPAETADRLPESYTHDENGNMTSMPHLIDMRWDHADRLVATDRRGGGWVYFTYAANGQRVRKVYEHGGLVEERIYLSGYEIFRRHVDGRSETEFERQTLHVLDNERRVALVETTTVDTASFASPSIPRTRYQLGNQLGSSILELDDSGRVFGYEEYLPFGSTAFQLSRNSTEVSPKRYRYVGKERDEETGLYHFGARYYASWLGRWTSVDPRQIVVAAADSRIGQSYVYVENKPITATDPDGQAINLLAGAIGAGIGALVGAGIEAGRQLITEGEITNGKRILAAAAGGAVSGGLAGLTLGASLAVQGAVAVGGAVAGGAVTRAVAGEEQTAGAVLTDAAIGLATFGVVRGGSALLSRGGSSAAQTGTQTATRQALQEGGQEVAEQGTRQSAQTAAQTTARTTARTTTGQVAREEVKQARTVVGQAQVAAEVGHFGAEDVAFGLTRPGGQSGALVRFAGEAVPGTRAELSAATQALAPGAARNASIAADTLKFAAETLRRTGGRLRFSLEGFSRIEAVTPGSRTFGSVTSAEFRGILANPFLRGRVEFYERGIIMTKQVLAEAGFQ